MSKPGIIVAEQSPVIRNRMARILIEKGHLVETTGSAACLMQQLLHGEASVVVLGDALEEGLPVNTLIRLLKSCNPLVTIILVSDCVPLDVERKVRQQGIFYRANRPDSAPGWDELQLAVACACRSVMPPVMSCSTH